MTTLFVASITQRSGGKGPLRARRGRLTDALHSLLARDLAPILAGQGGTALASMTSHDLEVRTAQYRQGAERASALEVALRFHEEAVLHPLLVADHASSLSAAFVRYVGTALHTVQAACVDADAQQVRITAWLPFASGVQMDVVSGAFIRAWGDTFRAGDGLSFHDPV